MDSNDKRDLDHILHILYKKGSLAWYKVYTDLGIKKDRADHLFKIGFAFNYLQIEHKGMGEYPTDNHYVNLTNEGVQFFSLSNFSGTEKTPDSPLHLQSFNVYINGTTGGMNLLDLDLVQLNLVITAYVEGKPEFTIAGQNYRPKRFHTFKIFENSSKRSGRELKKIANEKGSKKGFLNKYFSIDDLEEFGPDLTYSFIGNHEFGSKQSDKVYKEVTPINRTEKEKFPNSADEKVDEKPIFISYCWDTEEHEDHVLSFADELRRNVFNIDIDKIRSQHKTSTNFNQMMHEAFLESEHIIIVLSKGYKQKADSFQGGVGIEYRLILDEIDKYPRKYILVSFQGREDSIIPLGFRGRDIIDISKLGLDPLYRKLTAQPEYDLSPVSKEKPKLAKREIKPFAEYQNKTKPSSIPKPSVAENITARIKKKKELHKDFSPWLDYKKDDVKKRFRMIIHSAENDTYPEQPMIKDIPPTWFAAEIHGSNHLGIEFCNENTQIYIDKEGKWSREASNNLTAVSVSVIKTIAYDDILTWDMDGDRIYNCPHFYVNFNDGSPWTEIAFIDQNQNFVRFDSSNKIDNKKV